MRRQSSSTLLVVSVALLATTCSEHRTPAPSELEAALGAPGLGLGVGPGQTSRLAREAGQFLFGKPRQTQVKLGMATSAVSVTQSSGEEVKLRPLEGPDGFATWGPGEASGTAVIYPSRDGRSAVVERASATGLKEDLVLSRPLGDSLRFTWALELGEGLQARLESDGSVGVYGLSSLLSADIQVGDDESRVLLEKARRRAEHTERRFRIPAPVVKSATGAAPGVAHFELGQGKLTLVAAGLDALTYPVSLDPSVVITSATDFGQGGNLEVGVDLDVTGASVEREKTRRGVGAWTATTPFPTARAGLTSVAANGYLYVVGGFDGSANRNDVQFAPLNPDGTVGAFTATTSFVTPRDGHTSVAWNGYLYVIGGSASAVNRNDVQFARINPNGTLGAFTATTSFTTARNGHASVVWNGFLYVICGSNGTYLNDVQVAPINADGTLGAFTTTSPVSGTRWRPTSVAHHGRLYVLGGYNGTRFSDVQVAVINPNGTLGSFTSTTSFAGGRHFHTSVVAGGHVYVMGGYNGANLDDVQVAPINANGTLGPFTLSTPFATARRYHASVAYNGRVYLLGGIGGAVLNDVQVAPLDRNGTLGAFTPTTTFTSARAGHASVAYRGFLYVIGGSDASTWFSSVQVAPLNANGTLGAFTATTSFATGRQFHSSVAWNGYLYVIGGANAAGLDDVQMAVINPNGTLGPFVATTSLPAARSAHSSAVWNGSLYVIGGLSGAASRNDVLVAPINPNGTLGAFSTTTSFATPRSRHTSVAYNGSLYVIGGTPGAPPYLSDVQVAPINANGTLGAFSPTSSFPSARQGHTSVAWNGYLYVMGGLGPVSTLSDVQLAPINADGTLGPFAATTPVTTVRRDHASVAVNGYLYAIGGNAGGPYLNDVQVASLNSSGTAVNFVLTSGLPIARDSHASVIWNGYLYAIGGWSGAYRSDVLFTSIRPDGTLNAWSATTSLTTARRFHSAVAWNGYLYVLGGSNGVDLDSVEVAPFNTDGTLGAFTATTPIPGARNAHTSVAHRGYLYVIGGSGGGYRNDVQVAPFNPDGSLGAFAATTSFAAPRGFHSSVVANDFLYVIGGHDTAGAFGDVQVAPLNANGTLGAFAATASLPSSRRYHSSVASNGFLYVLGGYGNSFTLNEVLVSPINANGRLGGFTATTPLSPSRLAHTTEVWNGSLIVIGGSASSYLNDVHVSALRTPAAVGMYSKLVDLGGQNTAVSLVANGGPMKGRVRLSYRAAPASGVFGPLIDRGAIPLGAAVPLGLSGVRYLQVRFTLDDTQCALINPDAANERDLTDFTVNYGPDPVLTPAMATVPPRGSQTFGCSGGSGSGYTFALNPNTSGGSVNGSGVYVAGVTGSVTDVVTCTDSVGAIAAATVTVTGGVVPSPAAPSLPPRGSLAFTASGGSGTGYVWSLVTDNSGATLSPAGAYVAGATGSVTDTVRVTDSLGNTATAPVTVTAPLVVVPSAVSRPPRGTLTFTTTGGSGAGLTWSSITNGSGMTINPGSGLYTAGTVGGVSDVIGVTDSLGNTATATITVTAGVTLSPASATVAPRRTQTLVPSGGSGAGFTWSLPSNASGGTLVAGLYTAGSTGSVVDVAQVTDSLGNTATASLTVSAGVSATPASASVTPRGTAAFTASGGSGSGFSWTFQTNASGGSVTPAGAYTAGATGSVTDVLRVSDSLGNTTTVNVAVSAAITITPASPATPPSGAVSFSAVGGSGTGYTWALVTIGSNGATIGSASGSYVAGTQQGTDVVRVTDSLGNTATVDVAVTNALTITPSTVSLAPRAALSFAGTGGSGTGYVWTLLTNNSGATFTAATAAYQAGPTGGVVDTVRLTDSLGNTATATVNVTAGVTVSPAMAVIAPRGLIAFMAGGGSATGLVWSFQTNASGGTLDPATGAYVAGPVGNVTDVVTATDSLGNSGSAQVTVGAAVSITPAVLSLAPREGSTLSATGGSNAGFAWSFVTNASGGTLNAGTGAYLAGSLGAVTDVVRATDSLGNTAQLDISVTPGVTITPSAPSLAPGAMLQLVAAGGSGVGFSWLLSTNRSGATLGASSGLYQAGSVAGVVDELQVADSLGNTASASITVTGGLVISPPQPTVAPRQALAFTTTGGAGGERWRLSVNASGGVIDPATGAYLAGPQGDTVDTVEVTDLDSNVATTQVTVSASLRLAPASASVPPRGALQFAGQGGLDGGYTFSLATNASGATLDPATGAYQAGATGQVTDVVSVTDALGSSATATVTVTEGVTISPAAASVAANAGQTFAASGGSGAGYTWSLSLDRSGGSIDASTGAYVAGSLGAVSDEVQVTDSLGNVATTQVSVLADTSSPVASCGCQGGGSATAAWLGIALLGLLRRRGRPSGPR